MSKAIIPVHTPITVLDCEKAFNALDERQALYAYNFAKAAWNGAVICFFERSYQSPALLYLILKGFAKGAEATVTALKESFSELEIKQILVYISAFLDNTGNFKSFGDSKFVPESSQETFRRFFLQTEYWSEHKEEFEHIYSRIGKYIYSEEAPYSLISFSDKNGTTGYYSKNVTSLDAEKIKNLQIKKGIRSQNNRLVKVGEHEYILKVAAVEQRQEQFQLQGVKITIRYGEFAPFLAGVNHYLEQAKNYSANEIQTRMIEEYISHFHTGNMEKHLESQRWWIKDVQPIIETNIGFIESYLDPLRLRAEFEGFVAVVNLEQSQLLTKLVDGAQETLKYLPWGQAFEVEVFKKPDFTSLEVLAFGSSGIPVGINIPNYNQIRQHLGFKNVNLGNVYGKPTPESIQYTPEAQKELHLKYYNPSLFVIVALHELLGHGSGRLYHQLPNFPSPLDGSEFKTYYKQNEHWHSVFGEIASTYEQCKADSVALFLSVFEDVQETLLPKYTKQERWDIVFVAWFDLIVSGLRGLQYFDVASNRWLQAHIGASFAIFSVLREAGGIFQVKETQRNNSPYLEIHLNKESLATKGKQVIGNFLKHLQIYKSTANFAQGNVYFQKYLQVDQTLLKYRQIVIHNKRPRRLTVQPDVKLIDGKVHYLKFEPTTYGVIDSALSHFQERVEDIHVEWEKNNQEFIY